MPVAGVPNQVCSQRCTNRIEPPVTYCALSIDRDELAMQLPDTATVVADAVFALDRRDTQAADIQTLRTPQFVLTRARCDTSACNISMPMPREKGFIASIQLRQLAEHELWLRNRLAHSGGYPEHGVCTLNIEDQPRFQFATSFDSLQFHIRQETLDSFAYEHGARRIDTLSWPHGARDQTLSQLASALLPALRNPDCATRPFVDHIGKH